MNGTRLLMSIRLDVVGETRKALSVHSLLLCQINYTTRKVILLSKNTLAQ